MLSFKLLSFDFSLKRTLTLLIMLVKTIPCKTGDDTDTVKRTCRNFNRFNFQKFSIFMNDNFEYLQVLVVQGIFCQLQISSPVMASSYIYKLKINAKLQERTLARWDISIHHVPTVSCVNLQTQSFVFIILISCHGRFKATKKSSPRMPWNYQNQLTQAPLMKIQMIWDFFE